MKDAVKGITGYLPDERPSTGKLIFFALQQILVMFPATVAVALYTGFHVSTAIFASGLATLCFVFVTRGKIPLFYGSSFSYLAAIGSITGVKALGEIAPDLLISQAQFGIICSGLVSIVAGLIISRFGVEKIEKVLPPTVTGSVAIIIGLSLAGGVMTQALVPAATAKLAFDIMPGFTMEARMLIASMVTLLATILFSVYLKGVWKQLPILLGLLVGYVISIPMGLVDFSAIFTGSIVQAPHFTLPAVSWAAVAAIMPIAIATIPESTAHLFQLDLYVDELAAKKGKGSYGIKNKLGLNLIGDGIGDIVASLFGGPAGTNYGENLSTMAITKNYSIWMIGGAAILTIIISFFAPLSNAVYSIPTAVVQGACIYLFGIIAAQGIAIMISRKVNMFSARNLAVISTILIIGLGGRFGFGGMIPVLGIKLPDIATAAIFGILLNLVLSIGRKKEEQEEAQVVQAE
jgi:uracil permease